MILGINGIRLIGRRSGVGRAIEAFIRCLAELEHPFNDVRVYTPVPLEPASISTLPDNVRNVVLRSALPPGLWEQITLPRAHGARHVLFCPSYVLPLLARCPTLLVHHGSYEGYRDAARVFHWWPRFKARVMYPLSARRATLVTTVSDYSRADMARYYRLDRDAIEVIPEGVDTRLFRPLDDRPRLAAWRRRTLGVDQPFLLYVGKPTKRRNLPNLLAAFAQLKRQGLAHKLLLIGTALPGTSFAEHIDALGLNEQVITIDYASHEQIMLAYNACELLVYPSDYEGFGMPVLEAMACGTPVIALNNTAFPEFAGGVAKLLPDAAVDTLAGAIGDLLNNPQERLAMAAAGPARAADYDWRIVSRRYLDLLVRLIPARAG